MEGPPRDKKRGPSKPSYNWAAMKLLQRGSEQTLQDSAAGGQSNRGGDNAASDLRRKSCMYQVVPKLTICALIPPSGPATAPSWSSGSDPAHPTPPQQGAIPGIGRVRDGGDRAMPCVRQDGTLAEARSLFTRHPVPHCAWSQVRGAPPNLPSILPLATLPL